ncbi:MAG: hypothetical protein ACJ8M1_01195 [Chthoniobacterales bacterium]
MTSLRLVRARAAFFGLLTVLAFVGAAAGQTTQSIDRAQITRDQNLGLPGPSPTPSGTGELEMVTSPNDSDIGEQQLLRRTEGYQPFTASVAIPIYWTSNVALTNSGEQGDLLTSPVAAVGYQPRITSNLSGYVGVREQQFYYKRLHDFDFGSFDVDVGLTYTVPQFYHVILHMGYDYNRLTDKHNFDAFFENHMLVLSAELPVRISRAQQLSIGIDGNISLTANPEPPRRHDFDAYVAYTVQLTRAFSISGSGRVVVHEYLHGDRRDVSEMVALNANYSVANWFTVTGLASYAANQSNHSVFDYEVGDLGGTLSFSIRF